MIPIPVFLAALTEHLDTTLERERLKFKREADGLEHPFEAGRKEQWSSKAIHETGA